jgi:type IV secretion system protein VirB3
MTDLDAPREVKFHESANRHNLILGGEREWVLLSALVCVILIVLIQTWWSAGLGLGLWFASVAVLKRMGKADPIMSKVMWKHLRYREYYPGQSGIDREASVSPKKW